MLRYTTLILLLTTGLASAQNLSREEAQAIRQACAADARTLCGDVQQGGGAVAVCLKEQKQAVSDTCATTLADIAGRAAKN